MENVTGTVKKPAQPQPLRTQPALITAYGHKRGWGWVASRRSESKMEEERELRKGRDGETWKEKKRVEERRGEGILGGWMRGKEASEEERRVV